MHQHSGMNNIKKRKLATSPYLTPTKLIHVRSIFIRLVLVLSFCLRMDVTSCQVPPLSPYTNFFSLSRTPDAPISATFLAQ